MAKESNKLLFSTGTLLAYKVNKKFYNDTHFVWCTSDFDAPSQPATSNPRALCSRYLELVIKTDRHADEIKHMSVGILRGAREMMKAGVITKKQYNAINSIVTDSGYESYMPVVYLIDRNKVKDRCTAVCRTDTASDKSVEYQIVDLKNSEFRLINFYDILNGVVPISDMKAGE